MNQRLRNLLDQRASAWAKVQEYRARREEDGFEPTAEDGEGYTRSLDEVERLSKEIEAEERAQRLAGIFDAVDDDQRSTNPVAGTGEQRDGEGYASAFGLMLRHGADGLTPESRQTLAATSAEARAQAVGTPAAGGYLVPEEFRARMVEAIVSYGGIAALAEVMTTDNGAETVWPTNNDTGNVGAILAENTQVTEQDLTFGQGKIASYMYTSKLVRVSFQLLQDAAFDFEGFLARKLGERIGRAAAAHYATGTGTGQPQGLVTGLTKDVETATASKIAYDDLVDLEHSIDQAYRANAGYVLSDSALRALRKLKDTTGRPLWAPSIIGGTPSTINGRPYTVDNGMAAVADGAKPIVYGDIKAAYLIRLVRGAQVLRLTERYADYLQVGFLGFQRLDAIVQDASAAATLTVKSA